MTLSNSETVLSEVVKQMMKVRKIKDFKYGIDGGTSKTDGYIGCIIFFHVSYKNTKEQLVLKISKSQETTINLDIDTPHEREICIYTEVIPKLEKFCNERKISLISSFVPRIVFYYEKCIVMENLKMQDFHICPKEKPMDMAHLKLLLEKYGIWHGITMAFRDQQPENFSKCVSGWIDSRHNLNGPLGLTKQFSREFSVVMKKLKEKGRNDLVNIYKEFGRHMDDYVYRRDLPERDMLIISHGDAWSNNFLFKYNDDHNKNEPSQVRFLDFQLSKPESPATEIAHVLYNMGDETCFKNSDNLLNVYHKKLSETLKSLGSDSELFTMNDFKRHWKSYGFFSVLHSLIYVRVSQCTPDEAADLGKMAANGEDFDGAFGFEMKDMNKFWERVLDIFIHFGETLKQDS